MARPRKFTTSISDEDRAFLEALVRKPSEQVRRVQRARVMLLANEGRTNDQIAQELGISCPTVVKVLKKLNAYGVEGALSDLQRSGRSNVIQASAKAWVISLACSRPSELEDGPAAQLWSIEALRKYIVSHSEDEGYPELNKVSTSTVWEILNDNDIRPHQIRCYLEKKEPDFNEKARGVLLLYKRVAWILQMTRSGVEEGRRADELCGEVFISCDEKPGIQAIGNTADDRPPSKEHGTWSRDYEYKRHGTVSLLAGIDLLTGEVTGLVRDSHKSSDFIDFLKTVDDRYGKDLKICIIPDNHSVHRSAEVMEYLSTVPGRFDFTFTPIHASWLNLIESLFSKLARQALRGLRVRNKEELVSCINRWIDDVNASPVVYRWDWNLDDIWGAFTKKGTKIIN